MNDKSELLSQLKIDRGQTPPAQRSPWIYLLPVAAIALAAGAYFVFKPASALPVKVVTARALGNAAAGGGSVLDASG